MTPEEIENEVQRRLRMPYHRVIAGEPVEGYLGEVPELPGCYTAGETAAEALANLDEALAARKGERPKRWFDIQHLRRRLIEAG